MGQLPVLSRRYWEGKEFDKTTLDPPLGSGPYKIKSVDPGRSITYARVEDWWGKDLPVNAGRYNFDDVRYDYYRDPTRGARGVQGRPASTSGSRTARANWATSYDGPALEQGLIVKDEIPTREPSRDAGLRLQHPPAGCSRTARVRQALAYALRLRMDQQEPVLRALHPHQELLLGNSELASSGLPDAATSWRSSSRCKGKIPDEVFTTTYEPPKTDGSGNIRDNLREALRLLKEAGWEVKDGKLVNNATGQQLAFEILLERAPCSSAWSLPFMQNLERLGVEATVRTVDAAQYERRSSDFDYDMIVAVWGETLSPGNEQREFWGSASRPTRRAARTTWDQGPGGRRADRPDRRRADARGPGGRLRTPSTACCSGSTTSSRTGTPTWPGSRTGTSSARPEVSPPLRHRPRSPGGSTRPRREQLEAKKRRPAGIATTGSSGHRPMLAYILRRLLLILPTLFGIMVVNFVIVQAAPGGPVEQMISADQGHRAPARSAASPAAAAS